MRDPATYEETVLTAEQMLRADAYAAAAVDTADALLDFDSNAMPSDLWLAMPEDLTLPRPGAGGSAPRGITLFPSSRSRLSKTRT